MNGEHEQESAVYVFPVQDETARIRSESKCAVSPPAPVALWNFLPKCVANSRPELVARLKQYLEERSAAGFNWWISSRLRKCCKQIIAEK